MNGSQASRRLSNKTYDEMLFHRNQFNFMHKQSLNGSFFYRQNYCIVLCLIKATRTYSTSQTSVSGSAPTTCNTNHAQTLSGVSAHTALCYIPGAGGWWITFGITASGEDGGGICCRGCDWSTSLWQADIEDSYLPPPPSSQTPRCPPRLISAPMQNQTPPLKLKSSPVAINHQCLDTK